jgi:hypothetical protein
VRQHHARHEDEEGGEVGWEEATLALHAHHDSAVMRASTTHMRDGSSASVTQWETGWEDITRRDGGRRREGV